MLSSTTNVLVVDNLCSVATESLVKQPMQRLMPRSVQTLFMVELT